jgi:predicted transcriptional regulator
MMDDRDIPFSGKCILMYLADSLPDLHRATASEFCRMCSLSHPTAIKSLQRLVTLGLVARHAEESETHMNRARISYCLSRSYADHLMSLTRRELEVTAA